MPTLFGVSRVWQESEWSPATLLHGLPQEQCSQAQVRQSRAGLVTCLQAPAGTGDLHVTAAVSGVRLVVCPEKSV
jgi:hypothetical protein